MPAGALKPSDLGASLLRTRRIATTVKNSMKSTFICRRLYKEILRNSPFDVQPSFAFASRAGRPNVGVLASRGTAKTAPANDAASKRSESLDRVMGELNGKFGKGSVMKLSSKESLEVERISTGALTLDMALGGGIPKGRIVEIFGPESSGKTTLALQAIASVQKAGGTALLIDAEHAFEPTFSKRAGVDTDALLISQPDSGEQALEIVDQLVRSSAVDMVVIDSVAALVPRAELEGEIGENKMGLHARMMSQAARKISGNASKCRTTVIFINQIRHKIGVVYGSPEVTTGGLALKYYCSVRIDVRRIKTLENSKQEQIGIRVKAKVVKNKVSAPFRIGEFDILFDSGVNTLGSIVDAAEKVDVLKKKGAWYYFNDANLAQGREKVLDKLKQDKALRAEIEAKTREALKTQDLTNLVDDDNFSSPEDDIIPEDFDADIDDESGLNGSEPISLPSEVEELERSSTA